MQLRCRAEQTRLKGFSLLMLLGIWLVVPGIFDSPSAFGESAVEVPQLQGTIRQAVHLNPSQPAARGQVIEPKTGKPLAGVAVTVPETGFATTTSETGAFEVPELPAKKTIVGFAKAGYLPGSVTLDGQVRQTGLIRVPLQAQADRAAMVLDNHLRHLGDNSYSPFSAGAAVFRLAGEGPSLERRFALKTGTSQPFVVLRIGSVIGLDTLRAHHLGQSAFKHASTPMLVRLNGQVVGSIEANGDNQRLRIPAHYLARDGMNLLAIETGYQVPDGTYIDYDDMEFMHLVLEL